jgi:hypothetical protein
MLLTFLLFFLHSTRPPISMYPYNKPGTYSASTAPENMPQSYGEECRAYKSLLSYKKLIPY